MRNPFGAFLLATILLIACVNSRDVERATPAHAPPLPSDAPITDLKVFVAKKIITMEPALPEATAVAVGQGRIVAVGSLASLAPWTQRLGTTIDRTFEDKVLMPGFIDPHVHPSLPAVLTQFPFLAPDDWSLPTGEFPAARTPESFAARLEELVENHDDPSVPFVVWGYHPLWHGDVDRAVLSDRFPDQAVLLWHRSFHEMVGNDAAFAMLEVDEAEVAGHPEIDWQRGRFFENGMFVLIAKMPFLSAPERYGQGVRNFLEMAHRGGVTTVLDMGIGLFGNPDAEISTIREITESSRAPARLILTPIITDFLARGVSIDQALVQVERWRAESSHRVIVERHFKIMLDGAIFSGLARFGFPGYLDGHQGVWMAPLEVSTDWARAFWNEGYQIHAHTNGDASAAAFLGILRTLQSEKPRADHRFTLEHFAYTTEDQNRQLAALGAVVSANPYYHYILSDLYSERWLGTDRGHQMVRLGSLERLGVPFALHSDCPMAPLSPLTLAATAIERVTINGNLTGPGERVSLDAALRAITVDAAWILGWEDEIGSIRAGKRADFSVLESDPYEVGAEGLAGIEIWGTVFEGEIAPIR